MFCFYKKIFIKMSFKNFVLPISGIDFVRYIAIFSELSKYNIIPEKIYCASGGCLTSYIAMMSSFTKTIENWKFNSEMFIKSPTPITPKMLTFALNGFFFYRQNINNHVKKLFVLSKLQDVEIITGYYETVNNINRIVITTNLTEEFSSIDKNYVSKCSNNIVKFPIFPSQTNKKENLNYLFDFCLDSMYKTSNIPFLIQSIGDQKAIDFGIVAPSPFFIVNSTMDKTIYFAPINIDKNEKISTYEIIFYNIIRKDIFFIEKQYGLEKKFTSMQNVLDFIVNIPKYTLIIYICCDFTISLENFNSKEISKQIDICKENISYKLFYDAI